MANEKSKPITQKAKEGSGNYPKNQEVSLNADGSGGPVDMGTPFKYNPFGNTSNASMWSNEMSSGRFTGNVAEGAKIAKDDMKNTDPNDPQHSKPGSGEFMNLLNNYSG
jgi:hypothetical protein